MQLLKRKRDLFEDETGILETMEAKTNNPMVKCAVNILLDNKRKAKKLIDELPEESRNEMTNYPIYSLL